MNKKSEWRLGEIFLQKGWVTWEQLEEALALQTESKANSFLEAMPVPTVSESKYRRPVPILNLGEILIRNKWITWEQLSKALVIQKSTSAMIGKILLEKNFVTEKNLQQALAIQSGIPFVDFDTIKIPAHAIPMIPKSLAYKHHIFPLVKQTSALLIAISNPKDVSGQLAVQKILPDYEILVALATPEDIEEALHRFYGPEGIPQA